MEPVSDYAYQPELSIIIPLYNEEENLELLYQRLREVLDGVERTWELVLIDDGSTDRTLARALGLRGRDRRVRVVVFRRNFGQTAALAAGFEQARGAVVVTLDGDLQNDPRDVPRMLERIEEGYDIVSGWRKARKDKLITRRLPSIVANWLIGRATGVRIHDYGCTLKAYRSTVIKNLPMYSDMHRFIPAIAASGGARVCELVVDHHPRRFGTSKYGISRTVKVLFDLVVMQLLLRFSSRPLHWFGLVSLPWLFVSIGALLVGFVQQSDLVIVQFWTVTFPSVAVLSFILFAHLIFVGLLSELIVDAAGHLPRNVMRGISKEIY